MSLVLLLLLQITSSSRIIFDPVTDLVNFAVEVNFPEGLGLKIERTELVVPEFTSIQFNPVSFTLKPFRYGSGRSLIVIDACGHRVWEVVIDVAFFPTPPTIVPAYERAIYFKEPCDFLQLEMHWSGDSLLDVWGANFEIQGTATLE